MMSERMANIGMALDMLCQGMLGIFVVLGLISLMVIVMQKMDQRKK